MYLLIVRRVDLVGDDVAVGVHEPQLAVVVLPAAVGPDQAQEQRREVAERLDLFLVRVDEPLEDAEGGQGRLPGFGQPGLQLLPVLDGERLADAAGHGPGRMNLLAAERLDDLLAELPQANAAAGQLGMRLDQAEDVARRRVVVPAEQQVGAATGERSSGRATG